MVGNDPRFHLQTSGVGGPQQHGLDPQLRHKNLHAGVGVADLQHTFDPEPPTQIIDAPVARRHPQRRGGSQAVAELQPGHSESKA
jgi:hypothetical protein